LKQAIGEMFQLVEKWSKRNNPYSLVKGFNSELVQVENSNYAPFHPMPVISTKDWTDAYAWQRQDKRVVKVESKYYIDSKDEVSITDAQAKEYEKKLTTAFDSFDSFVDHVQSVHVVKIKRKQSHCNCSDWHKHYKCVHVIAVSCRLSKLILYILHHI
jgi:hypothetical protein